MDLSKLNELAPKKKSRKRLGCGPGSGHGKTSGRGHKGSKARSGGKKRLFEGGSMPLFSRLPKRGFSNFRHMDVFEEVKVCDLNAFEPDTVVTSELLIEKRIIRRKLPVKVLGNGTIDRPLTVQAAKFTKSAIEKIENVGGKVEVVN
jgi:large subunit ribosomal protein L15